MELSIFNTENALPIQGYGIINSINSMHFTNFIIRGGGMALQFLSVYVIGFLIWLGFTGSFDPLELLLGLVITAIVAAIFSRYSNFRFGLDFPLRVFKFIFRFLPVFIVEMVKANIDVARRVLNPDLPINPGMFRIHTDLKGDFAKFCLANSITLTPGTLTVDMDEKGLLIHSIDLKEDLQSTEATGLIPESFEKRIKEVFE